MARAWPNRANHIRFDSAAAIRAEIARAVPLYDGIQHLAAKGDQFQWGGPRLYADGRFATPDGKAHFAPLTAVQRPVTPASGHQFVVSTRRGKQFNSMIQRDVDPLTGAARDAVLISAADLNRLGLHDGDKVRLESPNGVFEGRLMEAPIAPGDLEIHWPEGNVLLSATAIDPESHEPDYNATVLLAPSTAP